MDLWDHLKYFFPKGVQIDTQPIFNDVTDFLALDAADTTKNKTGTVLPFQRLY